jgi:hypothetical protein
MIIRMWFALLTAWIEAEILFFLTYRFSMRSETTVISAEIINSRRMR